LNGGGAKRAIVTQVASLLSCCKHISTVTEDAETSTTIRTGIVDAVPFEWWTDGRQPASITVRSAVFGEATAITSHEPARYAVILARRLLTKHQQRSEAAKKPRRPKNGSVLKKPGWFESDPIDFGTTVF
jgi:hypothetical protein